MYTAESPMRISQKVPAESNTLADDFILYPRSFSRTRCEGVMPYIYIYTHVKPALMWLFMSRGGLLVEFTRITIYICINVALSIKDDGPKLNSLGN